MYMCASIQTHLFSLSLQITVLIYQGRGRSWPERVISNCLSCFPGIIVVFMVKSCAASDKLRILCQCPNPSTVQFEFCSRKVFTFWEMNYTDENLKSNVLIGTFHTQLLLVRGFPPMFLCHACDTWPIFGWGRERDFLRILNLNQIYKDGYIGDGKDWRDNCWRYSQKQTVTLRVGKTRSETHFSGLE